MHHQQVLTLVLVIHVSFQATQCAFSWGNKGKTLQEPLITRVKDNRPSVVEILEDSTPLTADERETIELHISGNPQLQYGGVDKAKTSVEEIPRSEGNKRKVMESRLTDLKTLRDSLHTLKRNPDAFLEYQNPTDYSSLHRWNQRHPLFKLIQQLDNIHQSIEKTHPAVVDPRRALIVIADPNPGEIEALGIQYIEQLTKLLSSTQANYIPVFESHFLNLERLTCETIYFFYKHQLITRPKLGDLLTNEVASKSFVKHVLQSFLYDQKNTGDHWAPLDAENILNRWLYFSCGNMFEGLPEIHKNIFKYDLNKAVFEAYQAYPADKKNASLERKMEGIKDLVFSKIPTRPENVLLDPSGDSRTTSVVSVETASLIELANAFGPPRQEPRRPSELSHLYQAMEYFSNTQPNSFALAHQTSPTLKTKLYLMSESTQILRDIQNLQLYLSKKFRPARWLDSIFEQPASTLDFNSFGRLGELELLANYVRLIDQNYSRQLGVMWTLIEFHQYCQFQPFVRSLKAAKAMLTRIAESS
ncbi:hypothetical protein PGTUg99_011348 [Puccinia graminis f. sp. tritici]|uniref:Uncharacterized protein n=1 Tax=Puccinia graminis f. sp. tritici TaxID=56615 RepID=A0A5B0LHK4_PUCGR|nr:hypothetical protein PGTUg99_011348 [Puccinia graminis f. sp. tritici]